ncbi:MAG: excinuclease ABC subunit UvrC [Oscillospiraceae bacterium]|nr:excinuclease ABC subunit UvrC [Oscillospiraceae bacterium]
MKNDRLPFLRDKSKRLPMSPGVYIMRGKNREILYIGKAKALKNRVSSYFRSVNKLEEKTYRMVSNAADFDTIVTSSEFEALVLECSMIKQHKPKYNILLKDDKGYRYIRISREPYPRITQTKQKPGSDNAQYLGPYTSAFVVNETVDELNRAFMLPVCNRKFPADFKKGRPCLNFHIKQCMGVCAGKISEEDYTEIISQALQFISGGSDSTIELLTRRMEEYSERMEFEKAASCRDRIRAIKRIKERQNVVFAKITDQDVVAVAQNGSESCAVVLKFRGRRLVDKQDFQLGEISGLQPARREFILSYYGGENEIPKQVSLDGECEDSELVARYLGEKSGHKVTLHVPQRGEQLKVVNMALQNAAQNLAHKIERTGRELAALDELARLLGLCATPNYIEAYDISNYGEQTVVGGMVVFENGRPLKSAYRKFNIKTVSGTDDYASMREVISRRFARYDEEKETGEGFGRLPDLILLDGGRGHVSTVRPLLGGLGFGDIPVFGMVKDDKHRTRAIAETGGEISILSTRSAFSLVSAIQDEAHRFSITFMKKKHTKSSFELGLKSVKGIGDTRAKSLFKHFKTKKAMSAATLEELASAPGMNAAAAKSLFGHLHSDGE